MNQEEDVKLESSPDTEVENNDVKLDSSPDIENEDVKQPEESSTEEKEPTVPLHRLNEVINKRRESDRKLAEMQSRLDALETTDTTYDNNIEPTIEQYDYDEEAYTDALVDYRVNKQVSENELAAQQYYAQTESQNKLNDFNVSAATYSESNPSYQKAVDAFGNGQIEQNVATAILESSNAPVIHHALLNDIDLLNKLENMPVNKMYRELGRLEDSLIKGVKKHRKLTNAPNPIDTNSGSSIARTKPTDDQMKDMSMSQWRAMREGR